jgi:hypothetical protein
MALKAVQGERVRKCPFVARVATTMGVGGKTPCAHRSNSTRSRVCSLTKAAHAGTAARIITLT